MQTIPLSPVPSQVVGVTLGQQNCQLTVFQKTTGLFVDVMINGRYVAQAKLARNLVPLVATSRMAGKLLFVDMQQQADPEYSELGSRFQLVYMTTGD